ncbi:MAG: class I SAM-dependent methyltransferase [Parcubacteria group bacterium]|nr:class I SAM-dependent methyltransferase [Parcubacteria group bacterium]
MNSDVARKIIQLNKTSYDQIARSFSDTRFYPWPILKYLLQHCPPQAKILDVGCGNGRLLELLAGTCPAVAGGDYDYTGVDSSRHLVELAWEKWRNKIGQAQFLVKDILDPLPFPDSFFDSVFCIAVLNHIPSRELQLVVLKEIYRILRPGGYLLMTNFNLWHFNFKGKGVFNYIIKRMNRQDGLWNYLEKYNISPRDLGIRDVMTLWQGGGKPAPLYYYAFTLGELKKLAREAGFQVIEQFCEYNGVKVPWWRGKNIVSVWGK